MLTCALNVYAAVLTRAVWAVLKIAQPFRGPDAPLEKNVAYRDYEWTQTRRCLGCKNKTVHQCIEWIDPEGRVVTAECSACGTQEVLW